MTSCRFCQGRGVRTHGDTAHYVRVTGGAASGSEVDRPQRTVEVAKIRADFDRCEEVEMADG